MLNNISIRVRLTLMSMALLTLCCVGLTLLLNTSADRAMNTIIATPTQPATKIGANGEETAIETTDTAVGTIALAESAKVGFRTESILYMLLIVIGGGALIYYISGSTLKPLKVLNEQVKNIHADNLSESIKVPNTRDEIAELTKSFNEMTDKLGHAFCLQQQFSASAAHELKTPLAVLQTKVDVFRLQNSHNNSEYEALVSVFEKQIYRLRVLVSNLLTMTQIDYEEEKNIICVKNVFEDIFEALTPISDKKEITLSMQCDDSEIDGNLDSMYRAFYNLVENAIKYNMEGGSVSVTVREEATQQVYIQISDTGDGIPDDCKKEVFEPFFRVDKSRSRELGGSGLGLALVNRIVEQNGGSITVDDNHPCGSVFTVIVPHSENPYWHISNNKRYV